MKKIVVHRPGGFSRLKLEEHADGEPGPSEVVVSTRAIGVNFADCVVRMGLYKSAREFVGWPVTPGFEFAGVVSRVGARVTAFRPGDAVVGVTRFGAYATQVVVPEAFLFPLPSTLDLLQAGSSVVVFLTAWYAVFELAALGSGAGAGTGTGTGTETGAGGTGGAGACAPRAKVLVHSAAGGVGAVVCQLARAAGADVLGVVGARDKVEFAARFGANRVVAKRDQDLWAEARRFAPQGFQAIFDPNGPETLARSYEHLAPMGRLVIYGFHTMLNHGGIPNPFKLLLGWLRTPRFNPLEMVNRNVTVSAFNLSYLFDRADLYRGAMQDLQNRLAMGTLRPLDYTTFPLERAADAHRSLQSGRTVGKLVLVP